MKTESKYYTPSIEEFHVGFEYEYEDVIASGASDMFKAKIENAQDLKIAIEGLESSHIHGNETRVKHLDREDLEELGWAYKEQSNVNNFIFERVNDSFTRLSISYGEPCSISIYRYGSDDLVPKAYIKNKSELRKLMVQLGLEGSN